MKTVAREISLLVCHGYFAPISLLTGTLISIHVAFIYHEPLTDKDVVESTADEANV